MNIYVIIYKEEKYGILKVIYEADGAITAKTEFVNSFSERDFQKIEWFDVYNLVEVPITSYRRKYVQLSKRKSI